MRKMTEPDKQMYLFIKDFFIQHMYSPSVREIMAGMGYKSTSTIHARLARLEEMGYIRKQQDAPRTMWIKGIKVIVDEKENILQDMPVLRRTSGSE